MKRVLGFALLTPLAFSGIAGCTDDEPTVGDIDEEVIGGFPATSPSYNAIGSLGIPLGMPVPEANFFGIVIAIQQKSGGNLSEALGNLSRVLRDRKKMAEKIQAMSTEAKASAGIIGSLPPIVMLLVWISTPDYIALLWTNPIGQFMLVCCVGWMTIGVLVMKKMINFDF